MTSQPGDLSSQSTAAPAVILLVDDDLDVLQLTGGFLRDFGYTVLEAQSAFEGALVSAQCQGRIDLLLTDLDLGSNLGTDLASLLLVMKPSLKVLVVSGQNGLENTLSVGNQQFPCLGKPFTRRELQQRITEVLGRSTSPSPSQPSSENY